MTTPEPSTPGGPDPATADLDTDPALAAAVLEIERHVAGDGWDQRSRLFGLVPTGWLITHEPQLAAQLALDPQAEEGALTSVEHHEPMEEAIEAIVWPASFTGCAAAVERVVLPPEADADRPDDEAAVAQWAHEHPLRQEVRIVAGVTRSGATYCALRLRSHDDDLSVATSTDLAPGLLELLQRSLEPPPHAGGDPREMVEP